MIKSGQTEIWHTSNAWNGGYLHKLIRKALRRTNGSLLSVAIYDATPHPTHPSILTQRVVFEVECPNEHA